MNESTRKALDRVDAALDRANRPARRRGFSTSPFVLGGGLILGYQLLVRLVPTLWNQILPNGYDQAAFLPGGAQFVWRLGYFCHLNFPVVLTGAVLLVVAGFVLGRLPATRLVAWGLAVASIVMDAAILVIALKAGMDAAGVGNVLG
jgi:hypothetical protein